MKIVMQCAGSKTPDAGCLADSDGARVYFVAQPELAPSCPGTRYARPDDPAADGQTWREKLLAYNQSADNPFNLSRAYQLYKNETYRKLAEHFGVGGLFILSAGWGLVSADFLLPAYDITFSNVKKPDRYKKRCAKRDRYRDFSMLPDGCDDDLVFVGGKDYRPLFQELSQNYRGERFIFYNSCTTPSPSGCTAIRYKTATRTNWHYECAAALIAGAITPRA